MDPRPSPLVFVSVGLAVAAVGVVAFAARTARAATPLPLPNPLGAARPGENLDAPMPSSSTPPPAPVGPETGSQFLERMRGVSEGARQAALVQAALAGKVPPRLRSFVAVPVAYGSVAGEFYAMPDHFGIGTDADWHRWPLDARHAQQVADGLGFMLPTKKMVDLIWANAPVKLSLIGRTPNAGETRNSVRLIQAADAGDETRIGSRGGIAAGHRKDVIVGKALAAHPGNVDIYGGRTAAGGVVQGQNASSHSASYTDYSQPPRYVKTQMRVGDRWMTVAAVLADPALAPLISDEGVIPAASLRYAT